MTPQDCATITLPPDALPRAILFLACTDAVRMRLVSRGMGGAFDCACWLGPVDAVMLPQAGDIDSVPPIGIKFVERVCQAVRHSTRNDGTAPLWLRFVRRDALLAVLAHDGLAEACGSLARGPFSFGPEEARARDNLALRWAARRGHVAVLDRLAAPPYMLQQEDAKSRDNAALKWAASNGHVAVLDRLAAAPFSLQQDDARSADNFALHYAAYFGHVAVLDRLAAPPYMLAHDDARSWIGNVDEHWAARNHGAVMDRLSKPPYSVHG